jgi:hypothetical protein
MFSDNSTEGQNLPARISRASDFIGQLNSRFFWKSVRQRICIKNAENLIRDTEDHAFSLCSDILRRILQETVLNTTSPGFVDC